MVQKYGYLPGERRLCVVFQSGHKGVRRKVQLSDPDL